MHIMKGKVGYCVSKKYIAKKLHMVSKLMATYITAISWLMLLNAM